MNYVQRYGAALAAHGYHVLPATGKRLLEENWTQWCLTAPPAELRAQWAARPTANCSMACGWLVGVDIDVTDKALADQIDNLAVQTLGPAPTRTGRAPKRTKIYQFMSVVSDIVAGAVQGAISCSFKTPDRQHGVDILGNGRQMVAYGIHPDTLKEYLWRDGSPETVSLKQLAPVTQEQLDAFLEAAANLLLAKGQGGGAGSGSQQPHAAAPALMPPWRIARSSAVVRPTIDQRPPSRAAVSYIMERLPNEAAYDEWIKVAFAVHGASNGADWGFEEFNRWSAKSPAYDVHTTARKWATLKPRGVTGFGSLVYLAQQHGIALPADIRFSEEEASARGFNASAALAAIGAVAGTIAAGPAPARDTNTIASVGQYAIDVKPSSVPSLPECVYDVPAGCLKAFYDHYMRNAHRPVSQFALVAALGLVATLAGRAFATPTNLRPNIFLLAMGESGIGKNAIKQAIGDILNKTTRNKMGLGLRDRHLIGSGAHSGKGLTMPFFLATGDGKGKAGDGTSASKLIMGDEIATLFNNITNRQAGANGVSLGKSVLSLYSDSNDFHDPTVSLKDGAISIPHPTLTIIGASTPEAVFEKLPRSELAAGFANRLLCLAAPKQRKLTHEERVAADKMRAHGASGQTLSHFAALCDYIKLRVQKPGDTEGNDYAAEVPEEAGIVDERKWIQELQEVAAELAAKRHILPEFFARLEENTAKLALLSAISRMTANIDGGTPVGIASHLTTVDVDIRKVAHPVITHADFQWAWQVVRCATETMIYMVEQYSPKSEHHKKVKKILDAIEAAGPDGMKRSELSDHMHAKELDAILGELIDEQIFTRTVRGRGRAALYYVHAKYVQQSAEVMTLPVSAQPGEARSNAK